MRRAFWLAVAWSAGVWSVLVADYVGNRIGDTKARRPIHPTH